MERVGVRELRRDASGILRRVRTGEVVEVTDRGRPVAVLVPSMPGGLERLDREGLLRRGHGDLLGIEPLPLRVGTAPPSDRVAEGRSD